MVFHKKTGNHFSHFVTRVVRTSLCCKVLLSVFTFVTCAKFTAAPDKELKETSGPLAHSWNAFLKLFTAAGSWRKVSTCSLAALGNMWVFPLSHIIAANPDATCRLHHAEVFSLIWYKRWTECWAVAFFAFGCCKSKWKNNTNPSTLKHKKCSKLILCN